ncbi:hypothetical protein Patl1_27799 [Pistacia atlantica]|uniref:Uncharacterized protein n=1 Tax=Pistacia atlantica TaxID=434234 RepID=A0ACC1BDJ1_9ROSI|nr:hypothetical protein Patl1_27799 [Pistacia atlantica]
MLDSGNFVLYNSSGGIIWESFGHPTDTILPTQRLQPGVELFSSVSETDPSTGKFRLKMQQDGNLLQYPINTPDTAPICLLCIWRIPGNGSVTFCEDIAPITFSFAEIEKLTEGFKEELKKLEKVLAEGEKEFLTEIKVIGKTHYRNLVRSLGYSFDGPTKVLVCNEEVELKQLERVIKVALWCIIDEPSLRPSMKKVLLMLEGTVDIPVPPNPASYLSCI